MNIRHFRRNYEIQKNYKIRGDFIRLDVGFIQLDAVYAIRGEFRHFTALWKEGWFNWFLELL